MAIEKLGKILPITSGLQMSLIDKMVCEKIDEIIDQQNRIEDAITVIADEVEDGRWMELRMRIYQILEGR